MNSLCRIGRPHIPGIVRSSLFHPAGTLLGSGYANTTGKRHISETAPQVQASDIQTRLDGQREHYDERWNETFKKIEAFAKKARSKDLSSPFTPYPSDDSLKNWLDAQRHFYRLKMSGEDTTLSDDRQEKLETLGFTMFPRNELWERRYEQLIEFVRERGVFPYDCDRDKLDGLDLTLFWWCRKQKQQYKKYKFGRARDKTSMTAEREAKLVELGFCFDAREASWNLRYTELEQYYAHHGDCLVPADYEANKQLADWVVEQRTHYKKFQDGKPSSMTPTRFELLQKLEFSWNAMETRWLIKYAELKEHMQLNGLGSIPLQKHNKSLWLWVRHQRRLYKRKLEGEEVTLTDKRIKLLDELRFPW